MLNLREPSRITTLVPSAKEMVVKGKNIVVVNHGEDEVRVLRNLGLDAPAPIAYYYDWAGRYKPFMHQKTTSEFLTLNPRAFVLNGLGSGKTMSVLWAFDYLRKAGKVRKMLIVSPLSTLERAWGDEIFRNVPHYNFAVVHGGRDKRFKLIDSDEFDILIINHDGLKCKDTLERLVAKEGIDVIVIDEIAVFRTAGTERWKALNYLVNGHEKRGVPPKEWVWGLTGTPTPNAPTDAWAQIKLISPARVPKFFGHFQETVMRRLTQFKWDARPEAMQRVSEVMQPAIRFATADCIDLPPTTFLTRNVELTAEQKKAYKDLLKHLQADVAGGQITAINEAVKLNKIIQVLVGCAYAADGEHIVIPSGPRVALVKEIIEEAEAKVIVFVPLTGALNMLADELGKDYTVEVIQGSTPKSARDRILGDFQSAKNPRVLVANPAAMAHGLTLTASNTIIWYAPTTSNEVAEQANARIVRPGQKLKTQIVEIEGSDLERKMYERLRTKTKMQGLLLGLVKG